MSIDSQEHQNKGDAHIFVFITIFMVGLAIVFGAAFKRPKPLIEIPDTKDKYVVLETNSLGCTRYRYNDDIVWVCPEDKKFTQIEHTRCQLYGKTQICNSVQEPVVKNNGRA